MTADEFCAAVIARRAKQDRKWGVGTQRDCDRFLAILLEEVGEVAKELNEGRDPECLVDELVDVAAVCAKWAEWGLPAAGDRSGVALAAEPGEARKSKAREISTRRVQDGTVHEMADFGTAALCGPELREPWTWTDDPVNCAACLARLAAAPGEEGR